jgi:DNA-binding phage protein
MALTRDFKETVMEQCKDSQFRVALLLEAIETYLEGDVEVGSSLLRDYLNATQSFAVIADRMEVHEPSLRRMVSANGNPTAKNLLKLFRLCFEQEGITPSVQAMNNAA